MNGLNLLIIIDSISSEKKHVKILNRLKIKFKAITHGIGTASSSLLQYFGLDEIEKIIIFSIVPPNESKNILKEISNKCNMNKPGNGIAFTIPLSSCPKYMLDTYKESEGNKDMDEISNMHLIVTIANDGYADTVMNSAKKAGATGGTTIHGRGLDPEKAIKFLGVEIEPEKDIVLILTDDEKKNNVMNEIINTSGLKTAGAGICFSLPVDSVVGINKDFIG